MIQVDVNLKNIEGTFQTSKRKYKLPSNCKIQLLNNNFKRLSKRNPGKVKTRPQWTDLVQTRPAPRRLCRAYDRDVGFVSERRLQIQNNHKAERKYVNDTFMVYIFQYFITPAYRHVINFVRQQVSLLSSFIFFSVMLSVP